MTNIVNKNKPAPAPQGKRGRIRTWLACIAIVAAGVGVHPVAFASHILPPCEYEDSAWCYWDGRLMGNGTGWSFVALWDRDADSPRPWPVTIYDRWIGPNM